MNLKKFNSYPLFPNFSLYYFANYIGYLVLGYYLNNKEFNLDDKMCIIGFVILLISLSSFVYLEYNKINFIAETYQNVPIIFMGVGMYLFIKYLDNITSFRHIKDNFIGTAIIYISICSYGMCFSHVIILKILSKFNPHSNLMFPIMFILIIFISGFFHLSYPKSYTSKHILEFD